MLGTPIARSFWDFPIAASLQGQYVQLAPLSEVHLDPLWTVAQASPTSFAYLRYGPFDTLQDLSNVVSDLAARQGQPFWTVLDHSGVALGWLSICDVFQSDGAFEIGSIWFSPSLQGTRMAREAIFLLMCLGMDTFEYERLVWRCQAQNQKSFRAALNLGFTHECQRRRKSLPLGRSKSRPLCAAPWSVRPSNSKHVPRRIGRQANCSFVNLKGLRGVRGFGSGDSFRRSSPGY